MVLVSFYLQLVQVNAHVVRQQLTTYLHTVQVKRAMAAKRKTKIKQCLQLCYEGEFRYISISE